MTAFTLDKRTLDYLIWFDRTLEQHQVTLVIAAQPPRGVALPRGSLPDYDPAKAAARYEATRATLEGAGLHVTDLAAVVKGSPNYFFRRDHHWTPDGAEESAQAVAATLAATPAAENIYEIATRQTFRTEAVSQEEQVGSFGEAIGRICGENPPAEPLTRYQDHRSEHSSEHSAGRSLRGGACAPHHPGRNRATARVKTSTSRGFLEEATGLDVLNASAVGGGPQAALESYLRSRTFHEARPSLYRLGVCHAFRRPPRPALLPPADSQRSGGVRRERGCGNGRTGRA
jgi:alginate biosynthesis protein AlgX